jgi:diguanylate cyclase (GGDEF)-like protein
VTLARNTLLAAALALVLGGLVTAPEHPSWWPLALAVGVTTVVHLPRQRFRLGASVLFYAWCEAALIVGLYLLPAGWVPVAVAAGFLASVGIRSLRNRTPPPRTAPTMTAAHALAAGVGALVGTAVADPYRASLTPAVTAGLVLAAAAYFAVMMTTTSVLIAIRDRVPAWRVHQRTLRHELPMFLGSVMVGLTGVAAVDADWRWLLALPVVLWLLHRAYAFRVRGSERRRMWSALTAATRSLNRPDEESVAAAGVRGAVEVFAVGQAELELDRANGSRAAWMGDHTGSVRPAAAPATGEATGTTVPLLVGQDEIGRLRVHFPVHAGPGNGELAALQVYADALAAALHDTATHEELHRLLARSVHEAQHDPLTGLLNRAALLARGETAVQLLPHAEPVALLLVDVDHFREINDTLGHAAGDEVLRVTAQRLRVAARPGELLGRLGGDEFALLVTDSSAGLAGLQRRAVRRGRDLVSLLAEEATISGVPVSIEASVGVVVAPAGTTDVAELLRRADAAMYQAKHGGGTVSWYDSAQDAGSTDRPALLAELREALERDDELVLVMQPVIDLVSGAPTGAEALVRWRRPGRGVLLPGEFVRAVENSDLLGTFTEYVIDKALAAAARWAKRGPAVPVAVNLSARSLLDPRLPDAVARLLRRHRVPGRRLVLEITETVMTSELPGIEEALTSLRALGVRLAVDDFGTGYASLTLLTRMPLDEVKVDGGFVARITESPEAAAIVRTTVELGRELGLRVVAEGVETAAQRQMLTTLGCPAGQGFHLATPTPVEEIGATLRRLEVAATRGRVVSLDGAGLSGPGPGGPARPG